MKSIQNIIKLFFFIIVTSTAFSQTHLSVDVNDPVYKLLEIAEIKGLISNLSQVRPYTKTRINILLKEIDQKRNLLSSLEKTVLDSSINKYAAPLRERTVLNVLKEGEIQFNNEKDSIFPMAFGTAFDFELRGDVSSANFHSMNTMEWFFEGDISSFISYDIRVGAGINRINSDAFSPFTYTRYSDGYNIILSGGLAGGGLDTGDKQGSSFSFLFIPELSSEFFNDKLHLGWARHRRDIGNGLGNLTLSDTARPYNGIDLDLRPVKWFNFHYSVGSLEDWFRGSIRSSDIYTNKFLENNEMISQNMFTTQVFEVMPLDWFYFSITNSAVWAKRLELAYMMPFILPMFAQNLTGDQDNVAIELSIAFKIPFDIKIYGTAFTNELRFNTNLFSDPSNQIALQWGIQWVVPKLPFTIASFQYTKIEPYTYTHYAQRYSFFDKDYYFDISWTNDGENLGYHLPPNSDEFLVKIESLPYKNLSLFLQYQYIRHGDGNWEEGQMEGSTDSGGDGGESAHAYHSPGEKDFLNDGIYEKIHIATIGVSYQFEEIPLKLEADYSFTTAQNYKNIEGNSKIQNVIGFKVHIYPDN